MKAKLEKLAAMVTEKLNDDMRAEAVMTAKNNGYLQPSIRIIADTSALTPCVNVDSKSLKDDSLDDTAKRLAAFVNGKDFAEDYKNAERDLKPFFSKDGIPKDGILKSVVPCLIGYGKNRDQLEKLPHRRFLDMAIVFRAVIYSDDRFVKSVLLDNKIIDVAGVTLEELEEAAAKNVEDLFTIEHFFGMRIITSKHFTYGATAVLSTKLLDRLAVEAADGGRIWLIPSSVHEMIAFDARTISEDEVLDLVKRVNGNDRIIEPEEVLTDSVYVYDPAEKELRIAISGEG